MQKDLIISSQNAGYVARVSCAFERAGLLHRLDVDAGTLQIVVPSSHSEVARQVVKEHDLEEALEPPGAEFAYLQHLNQDELQACIHEPQGFSSDEIHAAAHIYQMREMERRKALRMCSLFEHINGMGAVKSLGRKECLILGLFCLLFPPIAFFLSLYVVFQKDTVPHQPTRSAYTTRSRQYAYTMLLLSSVATMIFIWRLTTL